MNNQGMNCGRHTENNKEPLINQASDLLGPFSHKGITMSDRVEARPRQISPAVPGLVSLVQITDCHISAAAEECLYGLNTRRSFEAVSKAVVDNCGHLDLLLATGDLSDDGSAESYAYLAQQFNDMDIATFWLPGNHDEIDTLETHFTARHIDAAKHILVANWQIVMLDSTISGEIHGRVGKSQLQFLNNCLRDYPDRYALVCLHHQALETGSLWLDRIGLEDSGHVRKEIAQHDNVRAVLWGHVHQETYQTIGGIEWMSTPSSCVQFKPYSMDFALGTEAPGYRHLELYPDGRIATGIHRVDHV